MAMAMSRECDRDTSNRSRPISVARAAARAEEDRPGRGGQRGAGGEIQLTDAIEALARRFAPTSIGFATPSRHEAECS